MSPLIKKVSSFALVIALAALLAAPALVLAQNTPNFGTDILGNADLPSADIRDVIINLINILLGILGIIFLLLVLYGGFLWMTAGGNDESAAKGRKIIGNGIIGLIIIFVAFALTTFIFNTLTSATGP